MVASPVIYLTGGCSSANLEEFRRLGVGLMVTPHQHRQRIYGLPWAADTGCFHNPDSFNLDVYLRRLDTWRQDSGPPLFATAPDVLGDPVETWRRSEPVLTVLRAEGYTAALVAQDGLKTPDWATFDCLFLGGSTTYKLSEPAYQLAAEARRRGLWSHMGRVNSRRRYMAAMAAGYDSADGTFVGWGPDRRLPEAGGWVAAGQANPSLWSTA